MLTCKNVTVTYGKKNLIEDISFTVKKGELVVIIGKNGSGKTTLLRALSSNVRYHGDIRIEDTPAHSLEPSKRAQLFSFMPQILPQPHITLRQLVAFGRQPYTGLSGILSTKDWEIVDEVIALTNLESLKGSYVDKISGGERRKAFFAMMLAQKTPLLIADEPCANLDSEYVKYMLSLLKARREAGDTIVCVLHDINQAFEIADRLLVMDNGQLIFHGTPAQAVEENIPQTLFSLAPMRCIDEDGREAILYH